MCLEEIVWTYSKTGNNFHKKCISMNYNTARFVYKTSSAASYVWNIWIINCQDNLCFLYVSMENFVAGAKNVKGGRVTRGWPTKYKILRHAFPGDASDFFERMFYFTLKFYNHCILLTLILFKPKNCWGLERKAWLCIHLSFSSYVPDTICYCIYTTHCLFMQG